MDILNPFPHAKWHQSEGVTDGSGQKLIIFEFTILQVTNVTLRKFDLMAFSSVHFKGIALDKSGISKMQQPIHS